MAIPSTVARYLREHGIEYQLLSHPTSGSTHETALTAHIREDHIAKAVVLRDDKGDAMVVLPGDSWLHLDKLNHELGRGFQLDSETACAKRFPDCARGAIPALGAAYGLETFVDQNLLSLANVYFEAGDHRHLVHVSGEDFRALLRGSRHGYFSGAR